MPKATVGAENGKFPRSIVLPRTAMLCWKSVTMIKQFESLQSWGTCQFGIIKTQCDVLRHNRSIFPRWPRHQVCHKIQLCFDWRGQMAFLIYDALVACITEGVVVLSPDIQRRCDQSRVGQVPDHPRPSKGQKLQKRNDGLYHCRRKDNEKLFL